MGRKNPNPRPSICACGARLIRNGERRADPWPEENKSYIVEIYKCSNPECSVKPPVEYLPDLTD